MSSTAVAAKLLSAVSKGKHFDRLLRHVKVISAGDGKGEFEFKVEDEYLNRHGSLHGGMTATLADSLSTLTIATSGENKLGVSIDLSLTYIKGVAPGETLNIKSEVYKTGRTLAFARVDFYNQKGDIIATGNHTKFVGEGTG